jgi:hypothetical protein
MAKAPTKKMEETPADEMGKRPAWMDQQDYDIPAGDYDTYPKIKVIQALSPEVEPGHDKFIPKARAGQIIITTTPPRLIDGEEGVQVIPLAVKKRYAEYIPRKQGGGFVASYDTREEMEIGFTPGNDMTSVIEFLCVALDGEEETDTPTLVMVSCDTPSKLGVAKKWGDMIQGYKTLTGVQYHITAKGQKNKKGQFYYNYNVAPVGWTGKETYKHLEDLSNRVSQMFLPAPPPEI